MNITTQNINSDPYSKTPITLNMSRANIYRNSPLLKEHSSGELVEISGHLSLEQKYQLWNEYGKPKEFLHFSIEKCEVCRAADINKDDSDMSSWCIGWISENKTAFIIVDILNILVDFHHQHNAKNMEIANV